MTRPLLLLAALLCAAGCESVAERDARARSAPVCGSREGIASVEASALLLEGNRVFLERCSPCHGDEGHGDGVLAALLPIRPRNYHADPFKWGTRLEDISETIRHGRSEVMPAFEGALAAEEIRAAAFLITCWLTHN